MYKKVVLVPGNNNSTVSEIWFPYVIEELKKLDVKVVAKNMPDPVTAKPHIWLPFIKNELGVDSQTIAVGHSSGSVALLRYAEKNKVGGLILTTPYFSHFGNETEKASGYFDKQWKWNNISQNTDFIVQLASSDDPYIPIDKVQNLKNNIDKVEYIEFNDKGHMGRDVNLKEFPELLKIIKTKLTNQ
jgi:hypothetical protein